MPLKSELLKFLSGVPNTETVRQRRALLAAVGFDRLYRQITWEGTNLVFFNELLKLLCSEGQTNLEHFLRNLADHDLVGLQDSDRLITFAEEVCALAQEAWDREFCGVSHISSGKGTCLQVESERTTSSQDRSQQIQVALSSTLLDLPKHRDGVINACVRQGMLPKLVDETIPRNEEAITTSLRLINEAEIYVGIFGYRYGSVLKGQNISLAEMEYNRAVERNISRLIFLMHEEHPITVREIEQGEGQVKLENLKSRLKAEEKESTQFFKSPEELRGQLVEALSAHRRNKSSTFHYVSDIPRPPEPYIAHPYTLGTPLGRQSELNILTDWVTKSSAEVYQARILSVVAIGGMGKSALTWKWFNDIAPEEMRPLAGRIWWSFYESDAHFENFITRALSYVSGIAKEEVSGLPLSEREDRLLFALNQQPYLIVLDGLERILIAYARMDAARLSDHDFDTQTVNFVAGAYGLPEGEAQSFTKHFLRKTADTRAASFLQRLKLVKKSRILISTRLYPADLQQENGEADPECYPLYLPGLSDGDALDLWRASKVSGSREVLLPLFRTFDKHPLMIRLLAGAVANYRPAPGNFDRWRKGNPAFNPYLQLKIEKLKSRSRKIESVQSHILKFALLGLDEAAKEVLHTIAAFRMPASYETLVDLLVGDDKPFADEYILDVTLSDLEDRGLLGWDKRANRYDLHPVIRGSTWNQLNVETRRSIYGTLYDYFGAILAIIESEKINTLDDLAPIIQQYENLIGLEKYDEACELFKQRLNLLRDRFVACQQRIELLESLFVDSKSWLLRPMSVKNKAFAITELSDALYFIGRYKETEESLFQAVRYYLEILDFDGVCEALHRLHFQFANLGKLYEADAVLRQALSMSHEKLLNWQEKTSLYFMAQDLLIRKLLTEAIVVSRRLFNISVDSWSADFIAIRLALAMKNYSSAMRLADRAIKTAESERSNLCLIITAHIQGNIAFRINDFDLANEHLNFALTEAREKRFLEEEISIRISLAELHCQLGELETARTLLDSVWEPLEQGPMPLNHLDALTVLAEIEYKAGNNVEAGKAASKAYELAWCSGPPYACESDLEEARKHLAKLGLPEPILPLTQYEVLEEVEINPSIIPLFTNTKNWTDEAILARINEIKKGLDLDHAQDSAKKWWQAFEDENTHRLSLVLRLLEELRNRQSTLQEFFLAYVYSNTDNIQANLHYLDYVRLQKEEKNSGRSSEEALEIWAMQQQAPNAALKLIHFLKLSDEEFDSLLKGAKEVIGFDSAIGPARKWWETFENKNLHRKEVIFRLVEEVAQRRVTITDFYLAYLGNNTENIQAILTYLDYKIYKEAEEASKKLKEELDEAEEKRRKQLVDEVTNIRLQMEEEQQGQSDRMIAPQLRFAVTHQLNFVMCPSCQNFIHETATRCQMCESSLNTEEGYEELFIMEVDKWCEGIANYPGEVFADLVYRVIQEKLAEPIDDAIRHLCILDIADISLKLSRAAKYLVEEQNIAYILLSHFPDPHTLDENAQIVFAQIVDRLKSSYLIPIEWFNQLEQRWNVIFQNNKQQSNDAKSI